MVPSTLIACVYMFVLLSCTASLKIKNFGKGLSQGHIHLKEEEFYTYNATAGSTGVITHFWITGGDYMCGNDTQAGTCAPPLGGSTGRWNPFIDYVIFRYYIDGDENASIAFSPNMACGVGPFRSRTSTAQAAPTGNSWDPEVKGQVNAPWSSKLFGKGSADGGWFLNVRVPFGRSIRITHQLPAVPLHPEVTAVRTFVQIRGAENLPIRLGGVELPSSARLRLQRIDGVRYPALAWVNLLDVPAPASGALLMNTLAVQTASANFQEGCVHAFSPHDAPFPGLILATGTEDYYNSAYYFSAGQFTFAEVGQTWLGGGWNASDEGQWSAYRIHDDGDPQFFEDGFRLVWRVGDSQKNVDGVLYKCLAPPGCDVTDCPPAGAPTNATVWSYTWWYEF